MLRTRTVCNSLVSPSLLGLTPHGHRRYHGLGMANDYSLLGTIARLQIQEGPLKTGERGRREYQPGRIRRMSRITLSHAGVTGWDADAPVLDAHHRDHPAGKNQGVNGISVGFGAHYRAMRDRFGDHVSDGIAGENILVEVDRRMSADDLRDGLLIVGSDGSEARLSAIMVAEPCVEFTRYALRYPLDARSDPVFAGALEFLRTGMRGFYATYAGDDAVTLHPGDEVYLPAR